MCRLVSVAVLVVTVVTVVMVPSVRCRPQSSSASHPGGYHSTLLQYLSGLQQQLPAERRPDRRQQQQLADFLRTQQQQRQRQELARPQQQQQRQRQELARPQQQQQQQRQRQELARPQQQQQRQSAAPASFGRSRPVRPVRPAPFVSRRSSGGAIVFPGPAS